MHSTAVKLPQTCLTDNPGQLALTARLEMSSLLPDSSTEPRNRTVIAAVGLSLAALLIVVMATGPLVLWFGLALSCIAAVIAPPLHARPRADGLMRATAVLLIGVGLGLLAQGRETAVVPLIAGVGALAGWLPFCWTISPGTDDRLRDPPSFVAQLLPLISATTALVAAARLIPSGFAMNLSVAFPVLFLAAALSLIVATARLFAGRRVGDALFALTAMSACGIAADVALRAGTTTLPVEIVRGDVAGLAVWLHGAAVWLFLTWLSDHPAGEGSRFTRWRPLVLSLLAADLAGIPPLPGFWIRCQLILAMVSRQTASSITREFEPHAGMLTLAALFAITWGALLVTAISRIVPPRQYNPI